MRLSIEDRALPPKKSKRVNKKRSKSRKRRPKRGFLAWIGRMIYWCIVFAIWCAILFAVYVGYVALKMPQASTWSIPLRPPNIRIVDRHNNLIANRGLTGGEPLSLNQMSPWLPKAVIAVEDRRFYDHFGVDPFGVIRALAANLIEGRRIQGGSTLTQQLAKNLFLSPKRTLERKVQEALLALWLEHKLTKQQILEMYLNRVYLGSGSYGVDAASQRYFNKSARDLNLLEAATLAGLLKAPSKLSPARDAKAANDRAQIVLAAMHDEHMINDEQLADAKKLPIPRAESYWAGSENYVADQVVSQLPFLIGDTDQDIIVHTTIDMALQQFAEDAVKEQLDKNGRIRHVRQAALVSLDKSGAIRALIGGSNYATSQYNRAIEAKRQPGSTFKTFVYIAAVEKGLTPKTVKIDAPVSIGNWKPHNYGGKYLGEVTLATALARSLNSVAAQLIAEVGANKVIEVAHRLGVHSAIADNASIALGTSEVSLLEMTSAFIPLANGGFRPQIRLIDRITDKDGNPLYDFGEIKASRVLSANVVGMMNAMLTQTVSDGTAKRAAIGRPAAGKTGTSQNSRDAWFIGYTADYITGVWFGNDDGQPMKYVTGSTLPVSVWHRYMEEAEAGVPISDLPGNYRLNDELSGPTNLPLSSGQPERSLLNNELERAQQKPQTLEDILRGR